MCFLKYCTCFSTQQKLRTLIKRNTKKYVQENEIAGNGEAKYVVGMFKGRWKRETMGAGKEANVR
jgi:hypothetical protein